jgi:hypothetical protein
VVRQPIAGMRTPSVLVLRPGANRLAGGAGQSLVLQCEGREARAVPQQRALTAHALTAQGSTHPRALLAASLDRPPLRDRRLAVAFLLAPGCGGPMADRPRTAAPSSWERFEIRTPNMKPISQRARGLHCLLRMTCNSRLSAIAALLIASALGTMACANKAPPKSTTTTRTQSSVKTDTGNETSTDTKETTTERADGSTVQQTETKKTSATPR